MFQRNFFPAHKEFHVNTIEYGSNLSDTESGKIKNNISDNENMRSDSENYA